jgi:hypothetical protein
MSITKSFLFLVVVVLFSCSKDEEKSIAVACDGSNLTYNSGVSSIINSNCTDSGCHNSGSQHGGFTSYSGIKPLLTNGSFNSSVIVNQSMPKGSSLTQSQLNKLKCWVDNGFPEN